MRIAILETKSLEENTEVRLCRNDDGGVTSYAVALFDLDTGNCVGVRMYGELAKARKYFKSFK